MSVDVEKVITADKTEQTRTNASIVAASIRFRGSAKEISDRGFGAEELLTHRLLTRSSAWDRNTPRKTPTPNYTERGEP